MTSDDADDRRDIDDLDAGVRPPFGEAPGPLTSDNEVVGHFARGHSCGHSRRLYAEGPLLIADGDQTVAIRVAEGVVLVRTDVPDDVMKHRRVVETLLGEEGLDLLDEDTLWGVPVALQLAGLRLSTWDLWGTDIDLGFSAVRAVAVGDDPGAAWS
ncbi:MAG: hypothetical protein WD232_07600 [Acidimicrobiales bacterium]